MLLFDMAGRLIAPSRLLKTVGGDIDRHGIAAGVTIPTTGDYSGVTVTDTPADTSLSKTLTRTAAGKAAVIGSVFKARGDLMAARLVGFVSGGGSGATSGFTRRDFTYGFRTTNSSDGCYIEYRNPDTSTPGIFLTVKKGSSIVRTPINLQTNNPEERYCLSFWISKNKSTGGWVATLGEGDQIRTVLEISQSDEDFDNKFFEPFIEWDWTYASGNFAPQVSHLSHEAYYLF